MATTATATSPAPTPSSGPSKIVLRTMQSLVLLVILMGAVIAVVWLVLNPHPPAFRLDSLSLSGLPNASDNSSPPPELHVRIQLTASNPNKKLTLVIQDVDPSLALIHRGRRLPLSSHNDDTSSPDCLIGKRDRKVLTFEVVADPRPGRGRRRKGPFQSTVGEEVRKGSAVMSMRMKVSVKFMHPYWPSKRASVKVGCENLSVARDGKLKDGGKDCLVGFS